jgi:hypothetical protein
LGQTLGCFWYSGNSKVNNNRSRGVCDGIRA